MDRPLIPIKLKHDKNKPSDGSKRYIPQGIIIKCPKCTGQIHIKTPIVKIRTKGMLYGDEAYRRYQNKFVFTYSLIGTDHKIIPDINKAVLDLKSELCSSRPPESWALHMKYLCAGHSRKRHELFHSWDISKVQFAVDSLFQIIHDNIKNLFVYNIALTANTHDLIHKLVTQSVKNYIYIALIINVIDEFTNKKARPYIFFDSEKPTRSEKAIHAWARDAFLGSQYCLLYGFLAKGVEIPEPQFVPPASQPCLELADFVSYVIARYHFMKWQDKEIRMEPINFGLATYVGFNRKGDMRWERQVGYPWNKFYK